MKLGVSVNVIGLNYSMEFVETPPPGFAVLPHASHEGEKESALFLPHAERVGEYPRSGGGGVRDRLDLCWCFVDFIDEVMKLA
jgi:hypothetical protein